MHPSGGGIAVYFEDITQELMKGLELNNALIQAEVINKATHDVIWEWNLKTSTVKVNKNFNKLFGYAPKKNILNFEWWETRIHPEERDKVTDSINHALRAGHDTWEFEYRFADSKGHYHFVRDRAIILRDEHANPSNVTGSMSSIQELKEIESKLHDIAYSNSHVIRKPLANILGLIELLNEEDVQAPKELITLIKDSSLELDDVIKNIANMARS